MGTCNTAARVRGVSWCAKNLDRTRTRSTRFGSTAGLTVPVLNATYCLVVPGTRFFSNMVMDKLEGWQRAFGVGMVTLCSPTPLLQSPALSSMTLWTYTGRGHTEMGMCIITGWKIRSVLFTGVIMLIVAFYFC